MTENRTTELRREGRGQMTRLLFFIAGGVFGIMAFALLIAGDDK